MKRLLAFTLVELLVVISIIALLLGILMPSLQKARLSAYKITCLANTRSMEIAHWAYMTDWDGLFINVGLGHGGSHQNEQSAWINTLQDYYNNKLVHKCPIDKSPHWSVKDGGKGLPVPPSTAGDPVYRRSSFGVNNYLTDVAPFKVYKKLTDIQRPEATVHFLHMTFEANSEFAAADHPHVENWYSPNANSIPIKASKQVQINAHGGKEPSWDSKSNYSFLDGHAETREFDNVYTDFNKNSFDPKVAF